MSAILQEIRQLEAARDRGDISPEDFTKAKNRLLSTVEDATVLPQANRQPPPRATVRQSGTPASTAWGMLLLALCAATVMTVLVGQLVGDMTIAFTLVVTVFAAIVIAAFRRLEG
ncbi:SHOCT domain-containing protein [Phaeobacter gallaeciensis]|uniref:Short domain protein n=1 Tax=Phaeobacter gallaeciensis TaxID=60890 RepID=A0AAC9ZBX1_9RHOB|nr:SHOCT domain-containing protein [Phaeobacter gallaeciensis]AHD11040.1 Short domain protein [Phaeobacter gallaeciensis DSM 26640]ATE94303.1 Short domain protein [Phaeobacter gallaeciensis]ATE98576.1 Short domain protein [Phaeobacter gallaeciensis]ATF02967.1 Short domain protein [Phaeobacter gallaeciensis]ATF07347.1 Short domain protein [Phaeobacter gallaeciensis]